MQMSRWTYWFRGGRKRRRGRQGQSKAEQGRARAEKAEQGRVRQEFRVLRFAPLTVPALVTMVTGPKFGALGLPRSLKTESYARFGVLHVHASVLRVKAPTSGSYRRARGLASPCRRLVTEVTLHFQSQSPSALVERELNVQLGDSTDSTGEFDPGSERTLAARLTHASRTRKGFGPGTVAHG
jgi:hypothetical protein